MAIAERVAEASNDVPGVHRSAACRRERQHPPARFLKRVEECEAEIVAKMLRGDELWEFECGDRAFAMTWGLAIVRSGEVVESWVEWKIRKGRFGPGPARDIGSGSRQLTAAGRAGEFGVRSAAEAQRMEGRRYSRLAIASCAVNLPWMASLCWCFWVIWVATGPVAGGDLPRAAADLVLDGHPGGHLWPPRLGQDRLPGVRPPRALDGVPRHDVGGRCPRTRHRRECVEQHPAIIASTNGCMAGPNPTLHLTRPATMLLGVHSSPSGPGR